MSDLVSASMIKGVITGAVRYQAWRTTHRVHSAYADVKGVQLFHTESGQPDGEPVFLLHGGMVTNATWWHQAPALARQFRVIAPDTRAHGRSGDGDGPLGYDLFARDVLGLMEHLGIESAHFVGWSDGGCTSLALALEHPKAVRSMVLIGTPWSTANYYPSVLEGFRNATADDPEYATSRMLYRAVAPEPERWPILVEKLITDMYTREPSFTLERLRAIRTPTLVMLGAHDQFISISAAEELAGALPNGRLVIIPGATHFALWEKPKIANASIAGFLREG